MNKGQLIEAVQKKLGKDTTKAAADAAVNAVIDCITKAVKKEPVQVIGFGTFLASWDLPGASWSLLGPPLETPSQLWTTKEGPRVAPRGSWGGL